MRSKLDIERSEICLHPAVMNALNRKRRREQAPALRMLPHMQCIPVAVCFPSANLTVPYHIPLAVYFLPTSLSKLRWQPIFIPAQGSPNTIKTVGGEAVRRFFSLKYAVLLYTISTLFREPRFAPAKIFQESFLLSFFFKKA